MPDDSRFIVDVAVCASVEQFESELHAAGWTKVKPCLWHTPQGNLVCGPFRHWAVMFCGRN
jgi:hypothetical protein